MKRRHVVALLGLFSFGGAAAVWRLLQPLRRPDPREHLARTMAAVAEAMFQGRWTVAIGQPLAGRADAFFELQTGN